MHGRTEGHGFEWVPGTRTLVGRSVGRCVCGGTDYSQAGAYAVTICTQGGAYLFGRISDGRMALNDAGRLVEDIWDGLPAYYGHVDLDAFVVMPDHVHGVIVLRDQPIAGGDEVAGRPGAIGCIGWITTGRRAGRGRRPYE